MSDLMATNHKYTIVVVCAIKNSLHFKLSPVGRQTRSRSGSMTVAAYQREKLNVPAGAGTDGG